MQRALRTLLLLLIISMQATSPAHASIENELHKIFNGVKTNVSPAGPYKSARRNGVTGGAVEVRIPVVNGANLIDLQSPSFKAGCNGISAHFGGLSFINKAKLIQLLNGVVAGATAYAFQMATEGMCPTCNQIMSKLQSEITKINGLLKNSCQAGQQLASALGAEKLQTLGSKMAIDASVRTAVGSVSGDILESLDDEFPLSKAKKADKDKLTGNVMAKALAVIRDQAIFAATDVDSYVKVAQSFVGTETISYDNSSGQPIIKSLPPLMTINDFLKGGTISVYECPSSDPYCASPSTTTMTFVGIADKVWEKLYGAGYSRFTASTDFDDPNYLGTGIISKLWAKGPTGTGLDAQDIAMLGTNNGKMLNLLKSTGSRRTAKYLADAIGDAMAAQLTADYVDALLDVLEGGLKGTDDTAAKSMLDKIKARRHDSEAFKQAADRQFSNTFRSLTMSSTLRTSFK